VTAGTGRMLGTAVDTGSGRLEAGGRDVVGPPTASVETDGLDVLVPATVSVAPATAPVGADSRPMPIPTATEPIPIKATTPITTGANRRERLERRRGGGTDDMYHQTAPDANRSVPGPDPSQSLERQVVPPGSEFFIVPRTTSLPATPMVER